MHLNKVLGLFFICLSLHATRPLSGLNTKDFLSITENLLNWKDNPFIQRGEEASIEDLTLFAVIYNKNKAAALINNQIVKKGDRIGSFEVVSIQKQEVVLRNDNGIFKLLFRRKKNEKA
jgi:hypothetical protein